jgi:Glutaminase
MKRFTFKNGVRLTTGVCFAALISGVVFINSCSKSKPVSSVQATSQKTTEKVTPVVTAAPLQQNEPQDHLVTIANIRIAPDGVLHEVMFNELAELFTVYDATVLAGLQEAFNKGNLVNVNVNPWSATVLRVSPASATQVSIHSARQMSNPGTGIPIDLSRVSDETLNNSPELAVMNTTAPGLVNVIPDMATAQMMFDYIAHQCCALGGPFTIDHCISFQYCQDGCYARAHKMCWIINNKYNYGTHKIFSFANSGSDRLSVKCEKWLGCCVTWWYHVAPLVNINTPGGVKAYVFDPAMFDQPVLLATWLHAQKNPACSTTPNVSMINIQPTASYSPIGSSGLTFSTDPTYSSTNSTLISYAPLHTCY